VLRAYRDCCAVCRLRHEELLDAAHILPDGHQKGEPVVRNGLALCKLHHAAFDRHILGIRPDEVDGPMLRHGLQGFNGERIHAPRAAGLRPAEDFLAERFALFGRAG
jgi:putative restriction endonuclease